MKESTLKVGHHEGKVILGAGETTLAFNPPEALALASLLLRHASEILAGHVIVDAAIKNGPKILPVDSPPQIDDSSR